MIKFSVVVPCFNEEEHIGKCLESVLDQSVPASSVEVIVVDNGSTDNSVEVARKYTDNVFIKTGVNVGAVRNYGAQKASGDILVFVDGDCTMDHDWLKRAEAELNGPDSNLVIGGGYLLPPDSRWIEHCWLLETPEGNSLPKELVGGCIVIANSFFKAVGGFNEAMQSGEDSELSYRIKRNGGKVRVERSFNVTHWGNAKTQKDFVKRQIWHAQSYDKNLKQNISDPVFLITLIFSATAILCPPTLIYNKHASLMFLCIAAISPALLTVKRFGRAKRPPRNLVEGLSAYYLDILYLIGRSIGILQIAKRKFRNH